MEKAKKLFNNIVNIHKEIRKESEKYIRTILDKNNGNIIFDDYDVLECVSIVYDGGNHPEYATNAFSVVNGVFLNDKGNICFSIEDCDEYNIENVNWDDVFDVAMFMYEVLNLR